MSSISLLCIFLALFVSYFLLWTDPREDCKKRVKKEGLSDKWDYIPFITQNCKYLDFYQAVQGNNFAELVSISPSPEPEVTAFFWEVLLGWDLGTAKWFYRKYGKPVGKNWNNKIGILCQDGYLDKAKWVQELYQLTHDNFTNYPLETAMVNLETTKWLLETYQLIKEDLIGGDVGSPASPRVGLALSLQVAPPPISRIENEEVLSYLIKHFSLTTKDFPKEVWKEEIQPCSLVDYYNRHGGKTWFRATPVSFIPSSDEEIPWKKSRCKNKKMSDHFLLKD